MSDVLEVAQQQAESAIASDYQRPAPEDGASVLDDLAAFIRRYVVLAPEQADAIALWLVHTHAIEAAAATPYLAITSAEKRSGKTRLLEVLELLAHRAWLTGRCTAAVLVRKLDATAPTLLLDEGDAAFKGEKEFSEALRAILNAGHRRGAVASICVRQGGDWVDRDFRVFGPKAIAAIGRLPDTVLDRSIPIHMKRRAPGEQVDRFRRRHAEKLAQPLRERTERWAAYLDSLKTAQPVIPEALDDRAADSWEPLLAIADAAGGEWPTRARNAALTLSAGEDREDDSLGVRLLADVKAIFEREAVDRLPSAELVKALNALEEAPWGDLRGRPLDKPKLARLLRPYGVRPTTIRVGTDTPRGYPIEAFADAWGRYIPPIPPVTATSKTSATSPGRESDSEASHVAGVADVAPPGGHRRSIAPGGELARPSAEGCIHRDTAEVAERWRQAKLQAADVADCRCCGSPVFLSAQPETWDGLCPVCRDGRPYRDGVGHLVRQALELGAKRVAEDSNERR